MLKDGEYGQLFFVRIDMINSEQAIAGISPEQYRRLNSIYTDIVEKEAKQWGGTPGSWQGDGAVIFLGTKGDEDDIMRSGEAMSRTIIDRLGVALPGWRFRMGAASSPARFWTDVGRLIKSSGVVLAARLENEARNVASGSVLLIAADVHDVLDDSVKGLYTRVGPLLGGVDAYAYVPHESGELRKSQQKTDIPGFQAPSKIDFFGLFDPEWVYRDTPALYVALTVHPSEAVGKNFDIVLRRNWIADGRHGLPMANPVYSIDSRGPGRLTLYHANVQGGEKIQAARFYENGVFAFADRSWSSRYSGREIFRPEDAADIIKRVLDFTDAYYRDCLDYGGRLKVMLHVINITGHSRETSSPGHRPFVYTHDLCATLNSSAPELGNGQTARFLYNQLLKQSGLDI
ncbi:MAG: hypothetical protein ABIG11_07485 [bacterium]